MRIVDYKGNRIELTDERWQHIISEHPEVKKFKDKLSDVLSMPDLVKRSKRSEDVFLYYRYYLEIFGGKHLLAVVKIGLWSFLLTCYVTDRVKGGGAIWKRK